MLLNSISHDSLQHILIMLFSILRELSLHCLLDPLLELILSLLFLKFFLRSFTLATAASHICL